jgi:hypothetical protein
VTTRLAPLTGVSFPPDRPVGLRLRLLPDSVASYPESEETGP